jgi:hypothetical protein
MAVVSVKRQDHLSTSNVTATEKTASDFYVVVFDAPATAIQAETATDGITSIPTIGNAHAADSSRKVKSVTAKADEDSPRMVFTVQVDYSNKFTVLASPLSVPQQTAWDFSEATQTYFQDESDDPKLTVNTAGETFSELLSRETGVLTVTVTKNIAPNDWNPSTAVSYMSDPATAVNSATFTLDGHTIGVGEARFAGITCGPIKTENGIQYRERTIILKLSANWKHAIESRGLNEVDPDNEGKLRPIRKTDGTPVDHRRRRGGGQRRRHA